MNETTLAETAIRERIAREGRITFRDFMEMALYSAPGSYYGTDRQQIGSLGDYFTSPELHPAFGALVARQVEQLWVAMDRPDPFFVVEMGAGRGSLARDLLSYVYQWSPSFHRSLSYTLVDRSQAPVNQQRETLATIGVAAERVSWQVMPNLELGENTIEGCVLSNELLDALPVHRVVMMNGRLKEIYLQIRQGDLVETEDEPSRPDLVSYFDRLGFLPPEGYRGEVNLAAVDWMSDVARVLRRGAVFTLDYGYPAEELYCDRHHEGTLLCFYQHTLSDNPYRRIGRQDMTTHVDFTSVSLEGERNALETLGLTTQHSFLQAMGIEGFLSDLSRRGLRHLDYEANRHALLELLSPNGLGRVKLLVQQKGIEAFAPAGLYPQGLQPAHLARAFSHEPVPLLTRSHVNLTTPPETEVFLDTEGMWEEVFGQESAEQA